jgi:hypothetical protein
VITGRRAVDADACCRGPLSDPMSTTPTFPGFAPGQPPLAPGQPPLAPMLDRACGCRRTISGSDVATGYIPPA